MIYFFNSLEKVLHFVLKSETIWAQLEKKNKFELNAIDLLKKARAIFR
jgi:hypothetical protein